MSTARRLAAKGKLFSAIWPSGETSGRNFATEYSETIAKKGKTFFGNLAIWAGLAMRLLRRDGSIVA